MASRPVMERRVKDNAKGHQSLALKAVNQPCSVGSRSSATDHIGSTTALSWPS